MLGRPERSDRVLEKKQPDCGQRYCSNEESKPVHAVEAIVEAGIGRPPLETRSD